MMRRLLGAVALAVLAGCSGNSPSAPNGGGTAGPPPSTAAVTVGNDFFKSAQDGTSNPALTTVAVGGTVTWTWTGTGSTAHSVQSLGSPAFTSSAIQAGEGKTYQVTFTTAGTYHYDCAVHGAAMSGTIVVQ